MARSSRIVCTASRACVDTCCASSCEHAKRKSARPTAKRGMTDPLAFERCHHGPPGCSRFMPVDNGKIASLNGGGLCLGRVDFDAALEVGAVLDADARRGNVTDDRAIPLDVHAAACDDVANDFTEDDHVAGLNFRMEMGRRTHGKVIAVERD